jgi:hypothetical protein
MVLPFLDANILRLLMFFEATEGIVARFMILYKHLPGDG